MAPLWAPFGAIIDRRIARTSHSAQLTFFGRTVDAEHPAWTPSPRQSSEALEQALTWLELNSSAPTGASRPEVPGAALDSLPDALWIKDRDGRYLFANTAALRFLGATTDDIAGSRSRDWLPPATAEVMEEHDHMVLAHGAALEFEESVPGPVGERHYLVKRSLWRGTDGTVLGLVGLACDVTHLRTAESLILQNQEHHRLLEEHCHDVITRHGLDGCIRDISATCHRLLDYSREELLGTNLAEWVHPEDISHLKTVGEAVMRRGEKRVIRLRLRHRDHGHIWVQSTLKPVQDEAGRPTREIVSVTRDLTATAVSPAMLHEYANRLRGLTDSVFLGVLVVELNGLVLEANPAALRLLGRTGEEIERRELTWRGLVAPDQWSGHDRAVLQLREAAVAAPAHTQYLRPDGTRVQVLVGATLLEGTVDRCLAYLVDVSEHKQGEAEQVRTLVEEQSTRALAESAVRRLEGILSVTDTTLTQLDSNDFLVEMLARVRAVLDADSAAVWLVDEDNRHLVARASQGMEAELPYPQRIPFGQGAIGRVATTRQLVIVEDLPRTEIGNLFLSQPIRSLLAVPLLSNNKVVGVLHIGTTTPRIFTPNEAHLLQLVAERVATVIERSQLFDEVRSSREQLDALSRRLLEVQENERRHVARELHDDIGQTLTAVKIGLLALRSAPHMASEVLEEGLHTVDAAIDRVRRLSRHLRPAVLDDLGLVAALSWLVKQQNFSPTRCVLEAPEDGRFPPTIETACFRVAQEALNNALRHAQAPAVRIQLAIRGGNLNLSITDDGVGFDVEEAQERNRQGESLGLLNMEERVRLAGGRFSIQSRPGRGTLVRAIFSLKSVTSPWDDEKDEAIETETKGSALE